MVPKRNYRVRHPNVTFNRRHLNMNESVSGDSANVHEEVKKEHTHIFNVNKTHNILTNLLNLIRTCVRMN